MNVTRANDLEDKPGDFLASEFVPGCRPGIFCYQSNGLISQKSVMLLRASMKTKRDHHGPSKLCNQMIGKPW